MDRHIDTSFFLQSCLSLHFDLQLSSNMKESLGRQTMLELYGCASTLLNDVDFIKKVMIEAARRAKASIVQQYFHQFSPHGISGTIVIMESHINIHTWPEHDFAAIDFFTCGDQMEVELACDYLEQVLKAEQKIVHSHERGNRAMIQKVRDSQILNRRQ